MDERGSINIAQDQAAWLAIGLVCFVLTLLVVRDVRQLDASRTRSGSPGSSCSCCRSSPGWAEINGARLWVNLGFIQFQPAEFGRLLIVIFLASYLSPSAASCSPPASAGSGCRG